MRKSENIYQECRKEVVEMAPGTIIPSVRTLMQRFKVSQVTVTRAMNRLKEEGFIESRIGSGSVRSGGKSPDGAKRLRIQFLISDYASTFGIATRQTFERHFTQAGHAMEIGYFSVAEFQNGRLPIKNGIDTLIINVSHNLTQAAFEQFSTLRIPLVCTDVIPLGLDLDAVSADNHFGGALAANWLLRNGHRDAAILLSLPFSHSPEARKRGFSRTMQLAENDYIEIDAHTQPGENSTIQAYHAFLNYVKKNGKNFTGLFCDSDLGSLGVLRACTELGIAVPGELSIIGFDNIPECNFFHPALSSIDQCLNRWAEEAEAIINLRIAGEKGPPIQRYITPELILRESTAELQCMSASNSSLC